MQFNHQEYAFLSRRGSVPPALRAQRRPVPESEPWRRPASASGAPTARSRRGWGMRRVGAAARRGAGSARALYAGVSATWTALGTRGRDGFGGR